MKRKMISKIMEKGERNEIRKGYKKTQYLGLICCKRNRNDKMGHNVNISVPSDSVIMLTFAP